MARGGAVPADEASAAENKTVIIDSEEEKEKEDALADNTKKELN